MHHLPMGTVTLLFTDMEGSTRLLQQLGECLVAATRAQLGEQDFAAAWAEGRTMTPEKVLAAQGAAT